MAKTTPQENILKIVTWLWPSVLILCIILSIRYDIHIFTRTGLVLFCLAMVVIPLVCALVARIRKKPKIKPKCWMRTAIINVFFGCLCYFVISCIFWLVDDVNMVKKPIIYLYPKSEMKVSVELGRPDNVTHTYPKYNGGWQVVAQPNGDLTDPKTGRYYYALYWEGENTRAPAPMEEGFIVRGEDTINFLETQLAKLGLNEREAEEFIVYWLPKLESSPYNYIRFQTRREQDRYMPLVIKPFPKTIIRVMMEYANLQKPIKVTEQVLPETPVRDGFTVVEWGATELPAQP